MDERTFVTHRREDGSFQMLKAHLKGVALRAEAFAGEFGSPREGARVGLLHDIGKYSEAGQRRQRDPEHTGKVDHSTAGMQEAFRLGDVSAAFAIAGHHGGLPDMDGRLVERAQKSLDGEKDPAAWKREVQLDGGTDLPEWVTSRPESIEAAMYTRMLFSCLVDADYLDTEAALQGKRPRGEFASLEELFGKLKAYVAPWLKAPRDELCCRRNEILMECLQNGEKPKGLYTLTVPTGGGKTVASMAFALSHAGVHDLKRVIYVIPYTSIIEQTADTFSKILGSENVLEHHSQAELDGDSEDAEDSAAQRRRLACENWDASVIVTTAVQFFESMYAAKASRCRKLHSLARSVIIFDEAQTLPVTLLRPCISAIAELVRHYGATTVLCTATQPALNGLFREFVPELPIRELAPNPDGLFDFFQRVHFVREGCLSDEAVSRRLSEDERVLCVVNSRRRARDIFEMLPEEGRYHLSTLMTAVDRSRTLDEIRKRLKGGLCCRVVSTSLVEAGVDVDFPTVWREMSGLDSILQAAGRCNREGRRLAEESAVHIFEGEGRISAALRQRMSSAVAVLEEFEDINTRAAIEWYFKRLLWAVGKEELDLPRILEKEKQLQFQSVSEKFRMIDDRGSRIVYIPAPDNEEDICLLRLGMITRERMRRLGRWAVSLPPYEYQALADSYAVEDHGADGFGILLNPGAYNPTRGLDVHCESGSAQFA